MPKANMTGRSHALEFSRLEPLAREWSWLEPAIHSTQKVDTLGEPGAGALEPSGRSPFLSHAWACALHGAVASGKQARDPSLAPAHSNRQTSSPKPSHDHYLPFRIIHDPGAKGCSSRIEGTRVPLDPGVGHLAQARCAEKVARSGSRWVC